MKREKGMVLSCYISEIAILKLSTLQAWARDNDTWNRGLSSLYAPGWLLFLYLIVLAIVFQGESASAQQKNSYAQKEYSAVVRFVVDGDTIIISSGAGEVRVRLWGIDTPEHKQRFSDEARRRTIRLLKNRQVKVVEYYKDDYGRVVADIFIDGDNAGERLIAEGLAWVHIYYCDRPVCERWMMLQKKAREARLGLWQDADPVPPWRYKRLKK